MDIACVFNQAAATFDWAPNLVGDIASTADLGQCDVQVAVELMMFSNAQAPRNYQPPKGTLDCGGWWGDYLWAQAHGFSFGSQLWMLTSLPKTATTPATAQQMCQTALQPLIDLGIAASIIVTVAFFSPIDTSGIIINVSLIEPVTNKLNKFNYSWSWNVTPIQIVIPIPEPPGVWDATTYDTCDWAA